MEVPIKVLADDPQRIAVQWDVQKGSHAAQGGDMAAVTNVMDNTYASAADTAMRRGPGQASRRRPGHAAEQGQADEGRKPDLRRGVRGEEEGDPRGRLMADEIELSYVAPACRFHSCRPGATTRLGLSSRAATRWPTRPTTRSSSRRPTWTGRRRSPWSPASAPRCCSRGHGEPFKLVVRFDDAGDGVHTNVGITGHAHPFTRTALAELATANGGAVGLAVGV